MPVLFPDVHGLDGKEEGTDDMKVRGYHTEEEGGSYRNQFEE